MIGAAVALLATPLLAQEEASRLPLTEAKIILVEVVVRDRNGRPVTDLTPADFEILEDGAPQTLRQFVAPAPAPGTGGPSQSNAPGADASVPREGGADLGPKGDTIAFVFDRLSTEGRVAAQKAVSESLQRKPLGTVGVFSIETSLVILQDFTSDHALALAAVDQLGMRAAQAGRTTIDKEREQLQGRLAANQAQQRLAELGRPSNAAEAVPRAQAQIAATTFSMAQAVADAFDHLERDEHGFTTSHALTAIVNALHPRPRTH